MTASRSNPRSHQGFRFPKALAAAGLAAVLVGCGSGGSSDTAMGSSEPPEEPGPTQEEIREMQTTAIQSAIDTYRTAIGEAQTAIGLVTNEATSTVVANADRALVIVEQSIADLKTAIDEATELSEDVLAGYRDAYSAYSDAYAGQVSALSSRKLARDEYIAAKRKKERDDHAKLWIAAINDYEPSDSVEDFNTSLREKEIVGDLDIDGNNNIKLDDENGDPISPMNHMAPSRGLTAKRFTKTPEESYGVVISSKRPDRTISTDHGWVEYFYVENPDDPNDTSNPKIPSPNAGIPRRQGGIGGDVITPNPGGSLTINSAAELTSTHFGGASAGSLGLSVGETKTVRFLNVVGVLQCTTPNGEGNCHASEVNDIFYFPTGVTFTPQKVDSGFDDVIITVTELKKDSDFLAFGYWITDTGAENKPKYNIHTFAEDYRNGFGPVTGAVEFLTGSASYSGGAAGVYVLKEGDLTDNPDLYNGEFVAGVELKAQFDDDTGNIALSDQWKITGTIDGFRSHTNSSHNLSGWELSLEADLGADRGALEPGKMENPSLSALSNAVTRGGGATGSWNASFFGDGDGDGDADDHPDAIAGQFNGHFVNGHVVGAFGAEQD